MITIKNAGACGPNFSHIMVETDTVERGPVISISAFKDGRVIGVIIDFESITKLHEELGVFIFKNNPKTKPSLFSGKL